MEPVLLLDFFAGKQWSAWDLLDTVPGTTYKQTTKGRDVGSEFSLFNLDPNVASYHC